MDKLDLLIKHLTVRHHSVILDDVNFHLKAGETLALVGESGSGKSMIALAIMQLLPLGIRVSQDSQILFEDKNILGLSEIQMRKIRGRRISMIFQEAIVALNPVLTIRQQIEETLKCHFKKMRKKEREKRILSLLHEVGISDPKRCADAYPHTISGGMRQRAMIAIALASGPDILIADEPTTALDVTIQKQIIDLLRDIQLKKGMALLFITHDLGLVRSIADRVAIISRGKILEERSVHDFFTQHQNHYSQKLLLALPSWEKRSAENKIPWIEAPSILTVKELKIYFPIHKGILKRTVDYVKAVDGVNFKVEKAQTFALVGESGSGKTSIGKGILRLIKATEGSIQFLNHDLLKLSHRQLHPLRSDIQIIFQDPFSSMDPRMRVNEILMEGLVAQNRDKDKKRCDLEVNQLLKRVGLSEDCKNKYPHEFSGGQRQRICIARALLMKPKLIICDEPTSALDVIIQMEILQLLQDLQKEFDISYLLITHNLAVVAYLAHHVAVLHEGRIVEQGPVEKVLFQPQHLYTKKLLATIPLHK